MTDLEKISRPIIYQHEKGENFILDHTGYVKTEYGESIKYIYGIFLVDYVYVSCYSLLDDGKSSKIAGFKVKKLHDTK